MCIYIYIYIYIYIEILRNNVDSKASETPSSLLNLRFKSDLS